MSDKYENLPTWPEAESPCIGFCSCSHGDSVCHGCGRKAQEVDEWMFMDNTEKEAVWKRIMSDAEGMRWAHLKKERAQAQLLTEKGDLPKFDPRPLWD